MAINKSIERHERFRTHKDSLISEFAKDCIDDRNKNCMRSTIDIAMATAYHIVNEFATIDTIENDIAEIKQLIENAAISQSNYFKAIDEKIQEADKKSMQKLTITVGILVTIITFLLGAFKFVI